MAEQKLPLGSYAQTQLCVVMLLCGQGLATERSACGMGFAVVGGLSGGLHAQVATQFQLAGDVELSADSQEGDPEHARVLGAADANVGPLGDTSAWSHRKRRAAVKLGLAPVREREVETLLHVGERTTIHE